MHVIGGGLAGSEAAWQLARRGLPVVLHEMRPLRATPVHKTDGYAELVCSNSFRSDDREHNAVGLAIVTWNGVARRGRIFMQNNRNSALRELPGHFRTGKAAANHMHRLNFLRCHSIMSTLGGGVLQRWYWVPYASENGDLSLCCLYRIYCEYLDQCCSNEGGRHRCRLRRVFRRSADAKHCFYLSRLRVQVPRRMGSDAERSCKAGTILAAGRSSPGAERKAVAAAGAWFDRRVGPVAGTQNHVARAGAKYMYDVRQFDCIDSSRNTTSLLLVLDQLNLLRLSRRRRAGGAGFLYRWAAAACNGCSRRKDQWQQMVDRFLDGWVSARTWRSCPWSAGRASIRGAWRGKKRNARDNRGRYQVESVSFRD